MIGLYCHAHHSPPGDAAHRLCPECTGLLSYAHARLAACRFGNQKPTCKRCPVHCYAPNRRQAIREVMQYAGPRMILHHPLDAIRHLFS